MAPGGGYIIISENVPKRVMNISISNSLTLKAKVTKQGHSFIKKAKKDQMVKMNADALLMNTRIKHLVTNSSSLINVKVVGLEEF